MQIWTHFTHNCGLTSSVFRYMQTCIDIIIENQNLMKTNSDKILAICNNERTSSVSASLSFMVLLSCFQNFQLEIGHTNYTLDNSSIQLCVALEHVACITLVLTFVLRYIKCLCKHYDFNTTWNKILMTYKKFNKYYQQEFK